MRSLTLFPLLFLAGCAAVGTEYKRPEVALAAGYTSGGGGSTGQVARASWWRDYRDPTLTELIRRGMAQNLDIQTAQERIRQAQANLRATGVNAAISGSATGQRLKSGGDVVDAAWDNNSSLGAALVIDLFGGIRRSQEAARADLDAANDNLETQRLAWMAELIAAYSDARFNQQALALTRDSVSSRQRTVGITRTQLDAGAVTELDLAQAQALLDTANADLPQYQAAFDANVFAIAALLNEPAAGISAQMRRGASPLRVPGNVAAGYPADLLRNRPDVRSSEAALRAAVANVGVATADMLPAVSLSGNIANTRGTQAWSFGPQISLPVLNQGLLSAQRDARISAAKQAELAWRASITGAVKDVEVAQSNLRQYRNRAAALDKAAGSYGQALDLARDNYSLGLSDLLTVLDTDRSAASSRINAASARNEAAKEWATLQIAIGAGALAQ